MPILGIYASANQLQYSTAFESIATVTVGAGGASTITFSSIPSTYKHLQLRGLVQTNQAEWIKFNFNGDTSANYGVHDLRGDGASASATASLGNSYVWLQNVTPATSTFGAYVTDILDYTNTNKYKTIRALGGYDKNGSGNIDLTSNLWQSTSAINQIVITTAFSGTFVQYSSFALYGIKG